ncbi:succinyl-diaminopimelate desuccinylase [Bifidobacterium bohemicum]|uniref:Probable succinyl-diaminopimelate desuccinylase n=1 Tax=Bifidobacterium bohemicum DSM 22767 TaxID=1437606 RepID=A0A086ZHS4_9BIFI|nr:ArgE/DapE family deacylase [Bifidobacterium bohemicum]KFI46074.1 peptidase M20 family protein [Bifidobacterium bohemicum DSM 22767]SCC06228.1 succinyl-diaminopimelate desuccinylase [Bifidobacterium bohemicum]
MNTEQAKDLLKTLVAFHTENGNEKVVADYIHGIFEQAGIRSKVLPLEDDPTRANLVAEVGSGEPVVAVCGHMDTVSAQQDGWETDPFTVTEKGDLIYGRGVTDMKAGTAALVIAMLHLKEHESQIHGTVRFLCTAGEEVGMPGAQALEEQGYMKGVEALLVGEPSGYAIVYATKGEYDITVNMKGKAAHSSMPQLGINAVENLIEFLDVLSERIKKESEGKNNPDLGGTVYNIDVFHGGRQVNAIPESASAEINIRIVPEFDNATIRGIFDEEVKKFNETHKAEVSYSIGMDIVAQVGPKDAKLAKIAQSVGEKHLAAQGKEPTIPMLALSGATDGSKLLINSPSDTAYVVFGPGNKTMHCVNESLPKGMYEDFIAMYQEILDQYMGITE